MAARKSGRLDQALKFESRLEERFDEVRRRGDKPLGRFEARYLLEIKKQPQRALSLAIENWQLQKEFHDTKLVLEAALAARRPEQAQPVLEFLASNGTQHAALDGLVASLKDAR